MADASISVDSSVLGNSSSFLRKVILTGKATQQQQVGEASVVLLCHNLD